MARPMLGDLELQLVQKIDTTDDQVLAQHSIPALEGDFLQGLGRRATSVTLTGVITGTGAKEGLKTLRDKFKAAEPVSFVADIATATKVTQVIIEQMGLREIAGKPERFEYALTLREYIPPPPPQREDPPPPPPPPPPPSVDTGTLVVEVIVEGQPNFDFSTVTVTLEGTQEDGTALSRNLTNRQENVWTEENLPLGQYTVKAVVTTPQPMSGTAQATIRGGQTTQVKITLHPGVLIAKAFVVHFRFDSAFIEPCLRQVLQQVADYAQAHPQEKLLILGHTDKVGDDLYNQYLSERRARSVYAYLTFGRDRSTAIAEWNELRKSAPSSNRQTKDNWSVREYQFMLQDLGYYLGNIDEIPGTKTNAAVRAFQQDEDLPATGFMDDATWEKLIEIYMDQDRLAVPTASFFPNAKDSCDGGILKWLGAGEQDPVKQTFNAWRPNRRTEMLFVQTDTILCDVPQPRTFNLPTPGVVGSTWCLGEDPGNKAENQIKRVCFLTRKEAKEAKWLVQPAEPDKINVNGTITYEDGTPVANAKYVLIAPDGEYLDGETAQGRPIPQRADANGNFSYPEPKSVGIYILEILGLEDPAVARLESEPPDAARGSIVCQRLERVTTALAVGDTKPGGTGKGSIPAKVQSAPVPPAPVNPLIILSSKVVVVNKPYTNPARVLITLKTSSKFDRKGILTRKSSVTTPTIRLFTAQKGGTEITFTNGDNEFGGERLSQGVELFAETNNPSPKLDDFELTLTLEKKGPTPSGPPATAKMTAVEVTLDIAEKRTLPGVDPPLLSVDDKIKKGRFLRVQDPQNNSTRAMLIVGKTKPADFDGELILKRINDQVQVFDQEIPTKTQTPKSDPVEIKNSLIPAEGLKLWVEGVKKSNTERETGYLLGIKDGEPKGDRVLMTVLSNIKIKGNLFWNRTWDYNTAPKLPTTAGIAAVKEFLPGAKIELYIQKPGASDLSLFKSAFLSDGGKVTDPHGGFEFTDVPESVKIALRVLLEYRDSKVVVLKGKSNAVNEADFKIEKDKVIWHQFDLDVSKWNEKTIDFDYKDLEIKKAHFIDICDCYKSIWFGHHRLVELAGRDFAQCPVNYPEPPSSTSKHSKGQLFILKNDLKDRAVLLHEYGHFINGLIGMTPNHPDYLYNDKPGHSRTSKEHYEAAWLEGPVTFISCALRNDPIYHDGYDTDLTYHLDTDNTTIGPHCEGSIQETLWRIYKVHNTSFKDAFWKAFTDSSKRSKINNVFEFFDNWKDLGISNLDKLLESLKKFNMEFGYKYLSGADMFTAVSAPKTFDQTKKQFQTIDELFDNFGKLGAGTLSDYKEEFYNRNKFFNSDSLDSGSTVANPKIVVGRKYIVPSRFQVKI